MNSVECFESKGYARVDGFLDEVTVGVLSQYMENKISMGEWKSKNNGDKLPKYIYYSEPLTEVLLQKCKQMVQQIIGKELLPTYSYATVYQQGEELPIHKDREACEISVTVNVASKGDVSPFYTKYRENENQQHILRAGDAIIYKGCDVEHWRLPLKEGQIAVQFTLHYVDKNGQYSALEKDTRTAIGANQHQSCK